MRERTREENPEPYFEELAEELALSLPFTSCTPKSLGWAIQSDQ
jgi:hypothetical protein